MPMTLSIWGLHEADPDIFNNMALPDDEDFNGAACIANIMFECAELEVVYADPEWFGYALGAWSETRVDSWTRMWEALKAAYNPLHNYDRHEDITDDYSNSDLNSSNGSTSIADTTGGSSQVDVAGFNNGSAYTPKDKTTDSGSYTRYATDNNSATRTQMTKNTRAAHIYGNIGVTTSAQMLAGELDIRRRDIYNIICDEFKRRFCLLVY